MWFRGRVSFSIRPLITLWRSLPAAAGAKCSVNTDLPLVSVVAEYAQEPMHMSDFFVGVILAFVHFSALSTALLQLAR